MDAREESTNNNLHFTHPHPLNRSISPGNVACSGCDLPIAAGKDYFTCRTCRSFHLHKVCFHLPQSTTHPAHPGAKLTLAVAGGGGSSAVKCRACTKGILGFYYGTGGGGGGGGGGGSVCYHNLCLALPLAVMISGHPHPLKIHFSPPYDFSCDLCRKPSYRGWLYRCRFCEFDAHIACAIAHKIPPPPAAAERMPPQVRRTSSSGQEILHLLQMRLGIEVKSDGDREGEVVEEEKVSSPTAPLMSAVKSPSSGSRVSSVSEVPSYQFSDMCFSIDLHKSYSDGNLVIVGGGGERKAVPEAAVTSDGPPPPPASVGSARSDAGSKNWGDSQKLLLHSGKPTKGYGNHGGGGGKKKGGSKDAVEDAKCSCWRRLMMLCCCSCREYEKCSNCSTAHLDR